VGPRNGILESGFFLPLIACVRTFGPIRQGRLSHAAGLSDVHTRAYEVVAHVVEELHVAAADA
jgi:hypothetical protein